MLNRLLRLAAFQNPEFYKAQAMRVAAFQSAPGELRQEHAAKESLLRRLTKAKL